MAGYYRRSKSRHSTAHHDGLSTMPAVLPGQLVGRPNFSDRTFSQVGEHRYRYPQPRYSLLNNTQQARSNPLLPTPHSLRILSIHQESENTYQQISTKLNSSNYKDRPSPMASSVMHNDNSRNPTVNGRKSTNTSPQTKVTKYLTKRNGSKSIDPRSQAQNPAVQKRSLSLKRPWDKAVESLPPNDRPEKLVGKTLKASSQRHAGKAKKSRITADENNGAELGNAAVIPSEVLGLPNILEVHETLSLSPKEMRKNREGKEKERGSGENDAGLSDSQKSRYRKINESIDAAISHVSASGSGGSGSQSDVVADNVDELDVPPQVRRMMDIASRETSTSLTPTPAHAQTTSTPAQPTQEDRRPMEFDNIVIKPEPTDSLEDFVMLEKEKSICICPDKDMNQLISSSSEVVNGNNTHEPVPSSSSTNIASRYITIDIQIKQLVTDVKEKTDMLQSIVQEHYKAKDAKKQLETELRRIIEAKDKLEEAENTARLVIENIQKNIDNLTTEKDKLFSMYKYQFKDINIVGNKNNDLDMATLRCPEVNWEGLNVAPVISSQRESRNNHLASNAEKRVSSDTDIANVSAGKGKRRWKGRKNKGSVECRADSSNDCDNTANIAASEECEHLVIDKPFFKLDNKGKSNTDQSNGVKNKNLSKPLYNKPA